jgi:mannosyl-3-phosphoglycerate phosphatase
LNRDLALVIVTDVDGCLVDHNTYSYEAAADALEVLRRKSVPLILCSSKTCAELEVLQHDLGLEQPFICENGGALHVPRDYFPFEIPGACRRDHHDVAVFGRPYADIVNTLREVAAAVGTRVVGFSEMSAEQVAADCGLPLPVARLAKLREYDEPFRVIDARPGGRERLHLALRQAGLTVATGGRYDHVSGDADKGIATDCLRGLYRRLFGDLLTVGLGDGLNDVPLLRAVDVPVVVRSPASATSVVVHGQVPHARVTTAVGPAGWQQAVLEIVEEREERGHA